MPVSKVEWYGDGRGKAKKKTNSQKLWVSLDIAPEVREYYQPFVTLNMMPSDKVQAQYSDKGKRINKAFSHLVWNFYHPETPVRRGGQVILRNGENEFNKDNLFCSKASRRKPKRVSKEEVQTRVNSRLEIYGRMMTVFGIEICPHCETKLQTCPKEGHPNSAYWEMAAKNEIYKTCPNGCLAREDDDDEE